METVLCFKDVILLMASQVNGEFVRPRGCAARWPLFMQNQTPRNLIGGNKLRASLCLRLRQGGTPTEPHGQLPPLPHPPPPRLRRSPLLSSTIFLPPPPCRGSPRPCQNLGRARAEQQPTTLLRRSPGDASCRRRKGREAARCRRQHTVCELISINYADDGGGLRHA